MKKLQVYNLTGEVVGQHELSEGLFAHQVNPVLVHQVVVAQEANRRQPWAHTKDRSEVRGGGKKPWKQKGTGRARHGSIRSPLWRGGGVTFGPRNQKGYFKRVVKRARQAALRMVLSDKASSDRLLLIDSLTLPQAKTKQVVQALSKLPLKGSRILFVYDASDQEFVRSARNLSQVTLLPATSMNVIEVLKAHTIVLPVTTLSVLEKLYGTDAK